MSDAPSPGAGRERPERRPGGHGGRGGRSRDAAPGTGRIRHGGRARSTDPSHRSAQRPSERRRDTDPVRALAYDTLRAVSDGAYANIELPRRLRTARFDPRDAAFATELVYGVTRMRGYLDAVLAACSGRPLEAIDPPVLDLLRLGAHQVLGMRVPVHAAVDQTVGLARARVGAGAASFTNAVLRRVTETPAEEWPGQVAPGAGRLDGDTFVPPTGDDDLAIVTSHPAWMVRALRQALVAHGASTADSVERDLRRLLDSHNTPADVTLVARPGLSTPQDLLDFGGRPGALSPLAVVAEGGGDPGRIPMVRDGRAAVQDEGSQLVVLTLLRAAETAGARPGPQRWLDLCAGPGGKAGLLAASAIGRDVTLFCNEASEHRADLVEQAVGAAMDAGADVLVGVDDGRTVGAEEPESFDVVLLDAPCTGLGALRRRPDARWRRTPADVGDLVLLQEQLLSSGLDALRPGGVLGYVTCSPHDAETRQVVGRVVAGRQDVEVLDARRYLREVTSTTIDAGPGPYVQLWPHEHGTDAMFFALLRKRTL